MEVPSLAPIAPRRAAVLFHDKGGPLVVDSATNAQENALPAAAALRGRSATRVVLAQQLAQAVARCSDEPHLFSVDSTAVVVRVLGAVPGAGDVLVKVPRLKGGGIARHTVAVPEVGELDPLLPRRGRGLNRGAWVKRGAGGGGLLKHLPHRHARGSRPAKAVTGLEQHAPSLRVVEVIQTVLSLVTELLTMRHGT